MIGSDLESESCVESPLETEIGARELDQVAVQVDGVELDTVDHEQFAYSLTTTAVHTNLDNISSSTINDNINDEEKKGDSVEETNDYRDRWQSSDTTSSVVIDRSSLSHALQSLSSAPAQSLSADLLKGLAKNIFVFSSSGKPIFAKMGDEDDLITVYGLLQAVISIVLSTGDVMKSIIAGDRTICFLLRQSLYFVIVSSTGESPSILLRQLDNIYQQILFILTKKVHSVLEKNPSTDLRSLLGSDAKRILTSMCLHDLVPFSQAIDAVPIVYAEKIVREDVHAVLKTCVEKSGAV
jgi:hypothetical protein